MTVLSKMEDSNNPQGWWEENKKLLHENIIRTMKTSSKKEILGEMVNLINEIRIEEKED